MRISQKGLELIKQNEIFMSKPYLCPAGIPTIGYGSTFYENGKRVTLKDPYITKERAEAILKYTVNTIYGEAVNHFVRVSLTQNMFDALCSLTYNIGTENLRKSHLIAKLNQEDYKGASLEFLKWNKAHGTTLKGLTKRRKAEQELFNA